MGKTKELLIEIMRGDEELGLYDDSTRYAHNNFNMHETNNYQALKQGYEAGAIEMAKRRYSEEDLMEAWHNGMKSDNGFFGSFKEWFEQFKKK